MTFVALTTSMISSQVTALLLVRVPGTITNCLWVEHIYIWCSIFHRCYHTIASLSSLRAASFLILNFLRCVCCCGVLFLRTSRFSWGPAAVSNAMWTGVWVKDILTHIGVKSFEDGAKHVCFVGADKLPNGYYGTSIRREVGHFFFRNHRHGIFIILM